jgi:hypothetical protein
MILEGDVTTLSADKDTSVVVSRVFSFKWLKVSYKDNSAEWVRASMVAEKGE